MREEDDKKRAEEAKDQETELEQQQIHDVETKERQLPLRKKITDGIKANDELIKNIDKDIKAAENNLAQGAMG